MSRLVRNGIRVMSSALLVSSNLLVGTVVAGAGTTDMTLRDQTVAEVIPLQGELRALSPGAFGGLWVTADGVAHIGIVDGDPRILAAVSATHLTVPPDVRSVAISETALYAKANDIAKQTMEREFEGIQVIRIEPSIADNQINVTAFRANGEQLTAIEASFGPSVHAVAADELVMGNACTRSNCPSPLKAALNLYQNSAFWCTGGWFFTNGTGSYWWSTAGHCSSTGNTYQHPSGVNVGSVTRQGWEDGSSADVSLFPVSSSAKSNLLYTGNGAYAPITSKESTSNEVIGEGVCTSRHGSESAPCGTLTSRNLILSICQSGGPCHTIYNLRYSTGTPDLPGDSGSPMYYGPKIIGMASAGDSTHAYYNHIGWIENQFALLVVK